jgi:hypothetical protein
VGQDLHFKKTSVHATKTRLDAMLSCDFLDQPLVCSSITRENNSASLAGNEIRNMMNDLATELSGKDIHQGEEEAADATLTFLQEFLYD